MLTLPEETKIGRNNSSLHDITLVNFVDILNFEVELTNNIFKIFELKIDRASETYNSFKAYSGTGTLIFVVPYT